ncbi:MAG: response regulator transcription factor, partial [Fulvivirga sp.]|uniref:response regulator transcription factor n=1 Tax=Fulvivirga sp. TaxID=1931237 RepID=UPI0032EBB9E3
MARILIVEDEPAMQIGLKDNLEFDGYSVEVASDGQTGLDKILTNEYDLVVLDVMLPNLSGFDVCKQVRKEGNDTPIILLTARGEEIDKVLGLELGADDYMTKPFSVRELLARIKANLRRSSKSQSSNSDTIKIGNLQIQFDAYKAFTQSNEEVKLSHKEFEILKYLHENKGKVVSRYDLLENIWGYEDDQPTTRTVDNFIARLRHKVEVDHNSPEVI